MMTPFIARKFGADGQRYTSRVTGREYVIHPEGRLVKAFHNGRCIYGGESRERAFKMIELEDCI